MVSKERVKRGAFPSNLTVDDDAGGGIKREDFALPRCGAGHDGQAVVQ